MILQCEKKQDILDPSDKDIELVLKNLRSEGPCSFASLTSDNGSYVQVAGGRFTCLLEKKDSETGKHYRAYHEDSSTNFPDGSVLVFSGGEIPLKSDEWFNIDTVLLVFKSFLHNKKDFSERVAWRELQLD